MGKKIPKIFLVPEVGLMFTRLLAFLAALVACSGAAARAPNVVLLFADDMGYGDLGCYGARGWNTPNLDRLAKEGTRFTDFYVAQAVCSASRTALLTGCYPNRVGILGALGPAAKHGIADGERTVAQVLKTKGYATAIYGKWHLGHHPKFLPTRHGFDEYYGLPYSNDMWPKHPTAKFPDLPLIEGTKTVKLNPDQSQLTTRYTERAVKFIEKNKAGPFFVYVPYAMPHVPLHVSGKHRGKSKQGLYGDVVEEIDWSVGQIVAALKRLGLEKDTLVIFTSDNGPWLSYGNHAGGTFGLREGKGTAWEGGVRVPCIMRWPGVVPAGRECREPAMTIDVLPTLAALAGAELPKLPIDGKDITPLIKGEKGAKSPHEAYFFYYGKELRAVRAGKWKLVFPHTFASLKAGGKDGKPGMYVPKKTALALYHLEADRAEKVNLVEKHPDVVKRLQALAEKMRADLGDSLRKVAGKGAREPGRL